MPQDFWKCVTPFKSTRSKQSSNIILCENGRIIPDGGAKRGDHRTWNIYICQHAWISSSGPPIKGSAWWHTRSWKSDLDNKKCVGTLLMDLSKAFVCVPHGLLLCKLKAYGFSNSACKLIVSYLSNTMQKVKINENRNNWSHLKKDIPQGSCLGPIIFNIFINDIFYFIVKCNLMNYADDNTLSASDYYFDLVTAALQHDASNTIQWFSSNYIKVNPGSFRSCS